jgi:ankyrin repeat protein
VGERDDILEVLLEQGANSNPIDGHGNSPFHYAAQSIERLEGATILLRHGGGSNVKNQ